MGKRFAKRKSTPKSGSGCAAVAWHTLMLPKLLAQPTVAGSTPVVPAQVAPGAACQRRILMNTIDGKLIALDADNGNFCRDFGN
ncbi:hypothetical protein ACVXG7_29550 [Enterobacter hormaechei]